MLHGNMTGYGHATSIGVLSKAYTNIFIALYYYYYHLYFDRITYIISEDIQINTIVFSEAL